VRHAALGLLAGSDSWRNSGLKEITEDAEPGKENTERWVVMREFSPHATDAKVVTIKITGSGFPWRRSRTLREETTSGF
jgi:hypothetical protein